MLLVLSLALLLCGTAEARSLRQLGGVSAKCTPSHLEEDCEVSGLPLVKDIGFDAKIDDVNYVINVDILFDGKSYSILNLSAHNPVVCIDELVVAKVCAKVENLQWASDRVTGSLYVGVGVAIVGTKYFKVCDLDLPYAYRMPPAARAGTNTCACMLPTHGRVSFSHPGVCKATDAKYAHLCAKETEEAECDEQTLVGCHWEGYQCHADDDCTQYCPAPALKPLCLADAEMRAVTAATGPAQTCTHSVWTETPSSLSTCSGAPSQAPVSYIADGTCRAGTGGDDRYYLATATATQLNLSYFAGAACEKAVMIWSPPLNTCINNYETMADRVVCITTPAVVVSAKR
eukprot:g1859.t1